MNYDMRLHDVPFNMILNKEKDIEYRLNDDKRKKLKIGDTITFYKRSDKNQSIKVKIVDLKYHKDLLAMFTATFDKDFKDKYNSPLDVVKDTPYYTDEEVKKYGCIAIYFNII